MDNQNTGSSRPMVEGNWKCSGCGTDITKLPFQPDESRLDTLKCLDCHRAGRSDNRPEKKMFEGSWTCSDCSKEITKMPFEPSGDRPIKCMDCFKASRA